jgi:hypothetical protein
MEQHAVAGSGDDRHEDLRRRGVVHRKVEARLEVESECREMGHAVRGRRQQRAIERLGRGYRLALCGARHFAADGRNDARRRRRGAAEGEGRHQRERRGAPVCCVDVTFLGRHFFFTFLFCVSVLPITQ